jgi:hypothetical protein
LDHSAIALSAYAASDEADLEKEIEEKLSVSTLEI